MDTYRILNPEVALKAAVLALPPDSGFAIRPEFRADAFLFLESTTFSLLYEIACKCLHFTPSPVILRVEGA